MFRKDIINTKGEVMEKIKLELNPLENGVMLIWEGIEECAEYKVKLYARKNEPTTNKEVFLVRNGGSVTSIRSEYIQREHLEMGRSYGNIETISDDIVIEKHLIDEIEVDKLTRHLAIKDLAQLDVEIRINYKDVHYESINTFTLNHDKGYFVEVIAEDRLGNEITKSDLINFGPGEKKNNYIVYGGKGVVCC